MAIEVVLPRLNSYPPNTNKRFYELLMKPEEDKHATKANVLLSG